MMTLYTGKGESHSNQEVEPVKKLDHKQDGGGSMAEAKKEEDRKVTC